APPQGQGPGGRPRSPRDAPPLRTAPPGRPPRPRAPPTRGVRPPRVRPRRALPGVRPRIPPRYPPRSPRGISPRALPPSASPLPRRPAPGPLGLLQLPPRRRRLRAPARVPAPALPRYASGAAPPVPTLPGRSTPWPSRSPRSLDNQIVAAAVDDDLAGLLEGAHDLDDRPLRRLDVPQPPRAQELHLLLERRHRTLRHRAEDLVLGLLARGLQRQGQLLHRHIAQHALQ